MSAGTRCEGCAQTHWANAKPELALTVCPCQCHLVLHGLLEDDHCRRGCRPRRTHCPRRRSRRTAASCALRAQSWGSRIDQHSTTGAQSKAGQRRKTATGKCYMDLYVTPALWLANLALILPHKCTAGEEAHRPSGRTQTRTFHGPN